MSVCWLFLFVEEYLSLEDLDVKDVVTMIADMLLAGVDTVTGIFLMCFIEEDLINLTSLLLW